MARNGNSIETVKILISTTPPVAGLLDDLVKQGFYGKNRAEAAGMMVAEGVKRRVDPSLLVISELHHDDDSS